MKSNNKWFVSLKLFFISAGVVSLAVGAKFFIPLIIHFAINEIPALWSVLLSWLKPPYLYVIINGIIITIAAASRFHNSESQPSVQSENLISVKTPPSSEFAALSTTTEIGTAVEETFTPLSAPVEFHTAMAETETPVVVEPPFVDDSEDGVTEVKHVLVNDSDYVKNDDVMAAEDEDEFILPNWTHSPPPPDQEIIPPPFPFPVREKPLASSRFSNHRKTHKSSPEGAKALGVARSKRHETLENTWKMITEGRHVPLTRHLKKPDMWEDHELQVTESPASDRAIKSNSNITTRGSPRAPLNSYPSLKARKELSVGHEELNRRVEAFIKKFNEEMRIQRQESLNQYMEMINRGV